MPRNATQTFKHELRDLVGLSIWRAVRRSRDVTGQSSMRSGRSESDIRILQGLSGNLAVVSLGKYDTKGPVTKTKNDIVSYSCAKQ